MEISKGAMTDQEVDVLAEQIVNADKAIVQESRAEQEERMRVMGLGMAGAPPPAGRITPAQQAELDRYSAALAAEQEANSWSKELESKTETAYRPTVELSLVLQEPIHAELVADAKSQGLSLEHVIHQLLADHLQKVRANAQAKRFSESVALLAESHKSLANTMQYTAERR